MMYLACAFVGVSLFLVWCCVAMLCLGGGAVRVPHRLCDKALDLKNVKMWRG